MSDDKTDERFRTGNEFVIALTRYEYESDIGRWQLKAQQQADARRNDVIIIVRDKTVFRAYPQNKTE